MSGDSQNMERSTLERKDRAELAAVAAALGLKVPSRAKKADIVTLILDVVAGPGSGDAAAATDSEPPTSAAVATGEAGADGDVESKGSASRADVGSAEPTAGAGTSQVPDEADDRTEGGAGDSTAADSTAADASTDDASTDGTGPGSAEDAAGEPSESEAGNRSRRRRRRGRDRGDAETASPGEFDGEPVEVSGLLDLRDDGYGFLRVAGFLPGRDDVYVSVKQCRQLGLRKGDHLTSLARPAGHKEKNPALIRVETVNGMDPEAARSRPRFDDLTPVVPEGRLDLAGGNDLTGALVDAIAPLAKGQRALVAAPPRSGRTEVLRRVAAAIESNHPDAQLIVLLVDERPEEVTEYRRAVTNGEVVASTLDRPVEEHAAVAELTIEHAKRLVEYGHDVVILLDGLTRLVKAYNTTAPAGGHILSGGLDASAVYPAKRFFGAARNTEDGGSLTIVGAVTVDNGSALDAAIYDELKDAANSELRLAADAVGPLRPPLDIGAGASAQQNLLDELARRSAR